MSKEWTLILDFDSTIVQIESLDIFAEIALKNTPEHISISEEIKELTSAGMTGEISFQESLQKRMQLLKGSKKDVSELCEILKDSITPSFYKNREWLKMHSEKVFIISGGFRESILPVGDILGIKSEHVFANNFTYSDTENITGLDQENILCRSKGKLDLLRGLGISNNIIVVGDGSTDAEIKELGEHVTFIAFTENITRLPVVKKADRVLSTFDDVIHFIETIN